MVLNVEMLHGKKTHVCTDFFRPQLHADPAMTQNSSWQSATVTLVRTESCSTSVTYCSVQMNWQISITLLISYVAAPRTKLQKKEEKHRLRQNQDYFHPVRQDVDGNLEKCCRLRKQKQIQKCCMQNERNTNHFQATLNTSLNLLMFLSICTCFLKHKVFAKFCHVHVYKGKTLSNWGVNE